MKKIEKNRKKNLITTGHLLFTFVLHCAAVTVRDMDSSGFRHTTQGPPLFLLRTAQPHQEDKLEGKVDILQQQIQRIIYAEKGHGDLEGAGWRTPHNHQNGHDDFQGLSDEVEERAGHEDLGAGGGGHAPVRDDESVVAAGLGGYAVIAAAAAAAAPAAS